jgi:hypothetical protein
MRNKKPLDIAEFNRQMIAAMVRKQEKMDSEMAYLRKQLSFVKHILEEMINENERINQNNRGNK